MPTLETERLVLRPFTVGDAPTVQRLAGAVEIARTTQNIPHPYEDGMAEEWIGTHGPAWVQRKFLTLAMTTTSDGLVGAVTLSLNETHRRGELGYWVGLPFWNRGYATEAAAALLDFGFRDLSLNRIQARHMTPNPASGRVMERLGMQREGIHREYFLTRGQFVDLVMFAILRSDLRNGSRVNATEVTNG